MELNDRQKDIITGSLLGDGSLTKIYSGRNSAFRELHGDRQHDYLSWKMKELSPHVQGINLEMHKEIVGRKIGIPVFGINKTRKCWCLRTGNHRIFSDLEKSWYSRDEKGEYILDRNKRRIKVVPNGIKLTPLSVAVWFFDDGNNCFNYNKARRAIFYTMGFTAKECEILTMELKILGVSDCDPRLRKDGRYEIVVAAKSFDYFMTMVSTFLPCDSMRHKVFFERKNERDVKVNVDVVAYIKKMKTDGRTGKEIATAVGISAATVSMVLAGKYNTKAAYATAR